MIGELGALRSILDRRRALFLLPLKALVNDKQRQFERLYSPFGIRTIEATGETDDITPLLRGQYDIALLTYESLQPSRSLSRTWLSRSVPSWSTRS